MMYDVRFMMYDVGCIIYCANTSTQIRGDSQPREAPTYPTHLQGQTGPAQTHRRAGSRGSLRALAVRARRDEMAAKRGGGDLRGVRAQIP